MEYAINSILYMICFFTTHRTRFLIFSEPFLDDLTTMVFYEINRQLCKYHAMLKYNYKLMCASDFIVAMVLPRLFRVRSTSLLCVS